MKHSIFTALTAIVLIGCAERAERKVSKNPRQEPKQEHQMKSGFSAYSKSYEYHDPDCQLCRERRKQEVIVIVDSMLRERDL